MGDPGNRIWKSRPLVGLLAVATMVMVFPPGAIAKSQDPATSAATPAKLTWRTVAAHPQGVETGEVHALHQGKLYVGQNPLYVFDPAANAWRKLASAPKPGVAAAGAFIGERFYVAGGISGYYDSQAVGDLKIYDPATDTWSIGPSMPDPVYRATATAMGGKLYVVGGCTNWIVCGTSTLQIYDPATNTWKRSSYPEAAFGVACGVIREVLYCAGGLWDDASLTWTDFFDSTYAYDPVADSWSQRADMPDTMGALDAGAADGLLVIPHGYWPGFGVPIHDAFAYDPVTDTWRTYPAPGQGSYSPGTAFCFFRSDGKTVEVLTGFTNCEGDQG